MGNRKHLETWSTCCPIEILRLCSWLRTRDSGTVCKVTLCQDQSGMQAANTEEMSQHASGDRWIPPTKLRGRSGDSLLAHRHEQVAESSGMAFWAGVV